MCTTALGEHAVYWYQPAVPVLELLLPRAVMQCTHPRALHTSPCPAHIPTHFDLHSPDLHVRPPAHTLLLFISAHFHPTGITHFLRKKEGPFLFLAPDWF